MSTTPAYSLILIIYNPFSTGAAEAKAVRLAERLKKRGLAAKVVATEYSGHAEVLAYQACQESKRPLIISSSGDGGYNEVVNGVMRAQQEDSSRHPVCAILPAGNANDHRRSVRKRPLIRAITASQPEPMDLLRLTITKDGHSTVRYAHSYIGAGITSHAAAMLNKEELTFFRELLIVARAIFSYHPVAIITEGNRVKRYDSLIIANIHHMSKVLRMGSRSDINNGSFRVSVIPHRSQFWLFRVLLNILLLIFGLKNLPQTNRFSFSVPQTEMIHLDGEILSLPGHASAVVTVAEKAISTLR